MLDPRTCKGKRRWGAMTAALETLRGTSARIEAIRKQVAQLLARQQGARRPPPVVILGETGTGKGLLALVLTVRVADPWLEIWTGVGTAREYFAVGDYRQGIERARPALDWLGSTPATSSSGTCLRRSVVAPGWRCAWPRSASSRNR